MDQETHAYYRNRILRAALNAARVKTHRSYIDDKGAIIRLSGDGDSMAKYFRDETVYAAETYLLALGIPDDLDPLAKQPEPPPNIFPPGI